jgi:tetratricopeptide (TPR) repeat protein
MIDIVESVPFVMKIEKSYREKSGTISDIGGNNSPQVLFSFEATRIKGLDDLLELVASLDELPNEKREYLLGVCEVDLDFASLLINRAWWKEVKNGKLNVAQALEALNHTKQKAQEWNSPQLIRACLVAASVVVDEYGGSTENALTILDGANENLQDDVYLLNQRGKVFLNAGRFEDAINTFKKVIGRSGLPDVELTFTYRAAAISAAKLADWEGAAQFFALGSHHAESTDMQQHMSIGLMADTAFSQWKQGRYSDSLLTYADVLDLVGKLPVTEELYNRHLHATVRHNIRHYHKPFSDTGINGWLAAALSD